MKKLYIAEFNGTFCFVVDTDVIKEDRTIEAAYKYRPEMKDVDIDIEDVSEITSTDDIPPDWCWKKPLGVEEVYGESPHPDCETFFENKKEAVKIANRLKELDYDLDPTFVEDLQKILTEI